MSHFISVEIDDEVARQFVEWAHWKGKMDCPAHLAQEIAEACVRALDEDDA